MSGDGLATLLRTLVHETAGRLALEPRFELKATLAGHLLDDALAVAAIGDPGQGAGALAGRLAAAQGPADYLAVAYGEAKPAVLAAARERLTQADPRSARPLLELAGRQERHVTELGPVGVAAESLPATLPGRRLEANPARDGYVEVTDAPPVSDADPGRLAHAQLHAGLCAAELAGRTSHEHPELPLGEHVELARQAVEAVRDAERLDAVMTTALGTHWGEHLVGFTAFRAAYARDLDGRREALSAMATSRAAALAALLSR